jgi:hypothetical protein
MTSVFNSSNEIEKFILDKNDISLVFSDINVRKYSDFI